MFSFNPVDKVIKDLSNLETLLIKTEHPSEVASLIKEVELFCNNVFGLPNNHSTFITNIKLQAIPNSEDAFKELTNQYILKGKVKLLEYINTTLRADLSYKKKFPRPLPFTEKVTLSWVRENIGLKMYVGFFSLLVASYGVGVKYPLLGNIVSEIFATPLKVKESPKQVTNNLTELTKKLPKLPPKSHNEATEASDITFANQ